MEIEQLAVERPEALAKVAVDADRPASTRPRPREIVAAAGFDAEVADAGRRRSLQKLWDRLSRRGRHARRGQPAGARPQDGEIVALDGKVTLDENAGFRHPEHAALEDDAAADPLEARGQGEGPQLRQARRRGRHHRQRRRARHEHARRRRVRRRGVRRRRSRPTSSTSAAAPRAEVMADGLDIILARPAGQDACSSTSSAASPPATRSPTASSRRSTILGDEAHQAARRAPGRQQRRARVAASSPRRGHPLVDASWTRWTAPPQGRRAGRRS